MRRVAALLGVTLLLAGAAAFQLFVQDNGEGILLALAAGCIAGVACWVAGDRLLSTGSGWRRAVGGVLLVVGLGFAAAVVWVLRGISGR